MSLFVNIVFECPLFRQKEIDKTRRKRTRRGGRHQKSFTCRLPRPDKNSTRTGKTGRLPTETVEGYCSKL